MTLVLRGRIVAVLVAAFAFAGAGNANAAIITSHDDQGRTITFDVRAATVDTEWYASVLRASAHGNEISAVRIIIVPEPQVQAFCGGADAAACCVPARRRHTSLAISRSLNFWILPVEVLGISANTTWRGTL